MSALTTTAVVSTEFAGNYKLVVVTATSLATSDTITLTEVTAGVKSLSYVVGAVITGGADANFCILQVAISGLVITITSLGADGLAATDFTGTTVSISLLGTASGA